jgi:creatinine amidohydrolase
MAKPLIWANMTVEKIRDYLKDRPTVILPVGCTEQHGYHLPTKVDILNAEEIAKRVSTETGIVVMPTVNYTYSGGELPGTVNVSPNAVALYIEEICLSLAAQGVKNIVILLGHGGSENMTALMAFRDMFLRKYQHLDLIIALIPPFPCSDEAKILYKENDWHAGKTETSLMLYWAPELVHMDRIQYDSEELSYMMRKDPDAYQDVQKPLDSPYVSRRIRQRPDIQVGVMGYPEEASAELGEKMAKDSVREIIKIIQDIEEARSK